MKNILKSTLLLLCSVCLFAACDDDRDSNPTLQEPTTFTLNTPVYAASNVDLATSDSIMLSWSQPAYGFPAATEYQLQVSTSGNFTTSVSQSEADQTGNTKANYQTLDEIYTSCKGGMSASALAKALQQVEKWAEGSVPATQKLYVRAMAHTAGSDTIFSNVVNMNVVPYYVELKDAAPIIYYLVGACVGDGSWVNNAIGSIGKGLIPMFTIEGETYDKKTGEGKIEYEGYFPAAANFKIVFTPGDWNNAICGNGTDMGTSIRVDGGDDPGNITIANAGYYKIIVNTATDIKKVKCTITALGSTPTAYTQMLITGDFDKWAASTAMSAAETYAGAVNHIWEYELDASSGDTTAKFLTDNSWNTNWGSDTFPNGTGVQGGKNIPVTAGKYLVFFNDITGQYNFISE